MGILSRLQAYEGRMLEWRRHLHSMPETAFQEYQTAEFVTRRLEELGLIVHTGIAGTGVVGELKKGTGPGIGLRAELDALPIQEQNDFPHHSRNDGIMHACGHDGHMAILLGAAACLADSGEFQGTVFFIFQPAEENEGGARKMVEEGFFRRFPVESIFAFHNSPGLPAGHIGIIRGPALAAYDIFEITITGSGSHAAMPHLGRDPIVGAAQLVNALQQIVSRRTNPLDDAVLSVTKIHGGEAWNIIPDRVVLGGTVRTFIPSVQDTIETALRNTAEGVCQALELHSAVRYERRYPPTVNHPRETEFAILVLQELLGSERVHTDIEPSMGSEDFSFFLRETPGCYLHIGNGDVRGGRILHGPRYDFNDDILIPGAAALVRLVEKRLERH